MKLSSYFLPTLKETPAEAQIISHRLMLRAGMIAQAAAGIYSWLPLGLRVLTKISQIIREEQNRVGAQEILMSTLQPGTLWEESNRIDAYGQELLRFKDRRERELLYSPTNEEQVTDLFRRYLKSYRDLPKMLYQIQWKFRDEIRPRFGVMRGREFLMKDCYSFDIDAQAARETYEKMYVAYQRTFQRMGLTAIPVQADSGPIGGDLSHEFQILAETGESTLYYDAELEDLTTKTDEDLRSLRTKYAVAEEKYDPATCPLSPEQLRQSRGIEVGHIFYIGRKYTEALKTTVSGPDGSDIYPEMGCYGIGVSRLVGAIIEAKHDEQGIIWPASVAPFHVGIVTLNVDQCQAMGEQIYQTLSEKNIEVLYDDRAEQAGAKLATMDLIGLPWQIIIGPRGIAAGTVEVKNRATGEREVISIENALNRFGGI